MTVDEVAALVQERGEMLMVDVAIHFMVDVEEARALVEPLIASGQMERVWRPMTSELRTLCDCDREEVLHWCGANRVRGMEGAPQDRVDPDQRRHAVADGLQPAVQGYGGGWPEGAGSRGDRGGDHGGMRGWEPDLTLPRS